MKFRKIFLLFLLITHISSCTFFGLYTKKPETIGAIAPSSSYLAQTMIKNLDCNITPKRILEVGGGTGVMTSEIKKCLTPQDELIVYEIEEDLCKILNEKFGDKKNIKILCKDIRTIDTKQKFDYIVSTLPLNSFPAVFVKEIFSLYFNILKEDGVLSFFEYLYLQSFRKYIGTDESIRKTKKLRSVIENTIRKYSFDEDNVLLNLPPAVVYFLKNSPANK